MKYAFLDDDRKYFNTFFEEVKRFIKADEIHFYNSSNSLLKNLNEKNYYDVIFLDIDMIEINGIDLSRKIYNEINKDIIIVFITNKKELVYDAFGLNVLSFIYKPDLSLQLGKVFELIHYTLMNKETYMIDSVEGTIACKISEIIYIERINRKVYIYTKNKLLKTRYNNLIEVENLLKYNSFVYINRSIIVNLTHAYKILDGFIYINDELKLDISQARLNTVTKEFIKIHSKG